MYFTTEMLYWSLTLRKLCSLEFVLLQKCCKEMEQRCCDVEDFVRKAVKVLHSCSTTSHVSDVDARLEKLCRRISKVQSRLADRCTAVIASC